MVSSMEVPARPRISSRLPPPGLQLGHLLDLLGAQRLIVDHHAVGAGRGDNAVERHHHNARIAGLLDRAIEGRGRGRIDDDGVIALKDQVLHLRRLGGNGAVGVW